MKLKTVLIIISIFSTLGVASQETNAPKFGKGLFNLVGKDSSFTMKIATRMQFLSTSQWDIDGGLTNRSSSNMVRRARLKFDGFAYTPKLKYKLELGLSNRDISGASQFTHNAPRYILDAVIKWNFHENFVLWVGQTKLPGNRERVISSGNLQQVDRSLLNSRFNIDRDMGIQLRHHFNLTDKFIVKEMFAISQGEGRNVTTGNLGGYQYTSRVEVLPFGNFTSKGDYSGSDLKFEKKPKFALGFTYDYNNNAVKNRSNMGSYMTTDVGFHETDITTIFVDAMYKHRGFSVMAEYAKRTADDPYARNSDNTLTGAVVQVGNALNLQTGYMLSKTFELSGRFTNVNFDDIVVGKGDENQYTLGLSKYIVGHKLKVQSDFSYLEKKNLTDRFMFRLQVDIHF